MWGRESRSHVPPLGREVPLLLPTEACGWWLYFEKSPSLQGNGRARKKSHTLALLLVFRFQSVEGWQLRLIDYSSFTSSSSFLRRLFLSCCYFKVEPGSCHLPSTCWGPTWLWEIPFSLLLRWERGGRVVKQLATHWQYPECTTVWVLRNSHCGWDCKQSHMVFLNITFAWKELGCYFCVVWLSVQLQ